MLKNIGEAEGLILGIPRRLRRHLITTVYQEAFRIPYMVPVDVASIVMLRPRLTGLEYRNRCEASVR